MLAVDRPDLVPWWFALGFWVVFATLTVVVVRDVRRAGGLRAVVAAARAWWAERTGPDRDQ